MGNLKEIGKNLADFIRTGTKGISYDLSYRHYSHVVGRIKGLPSNLGSVLNHVNNPSSAVHEYSLIPFINKKGRKDLGFEDGSGSVREAGINWYRDNRERGDIEGKKITRFQHFHSLAWIDRVHSLQEGETFISFLPHRDDFKSGVAIVQVTKRDGKLEACSRLLPVMSSKEARKFLDALGEHGQIISLKDGENSPLWSGVKTQGALDFFEKEEEFKSFIGGILGQEFWQRSIPTCQDCQVNSQPRAGENPTLTPAQVERARDHVPLTQRLYSPPEPLLRPPVLMSQNNGTEESVDRNSNGGGGLSGPGQLSPSSTPESFPLGFPTPVLTSKSIYQEPATAAIRPQSAAIAVQETNFHQPSELVSMFQIIETNSLPKEVVLPQEQTSKQAVVQEAPAVLPKKQISPELLYSEQVGARIRTQTGLVFERGKQLVLEEKKTEKVEDWLAVKPERSLRRKLMVRQEKQEAREETITVPLIEIATATPTIYSRREKRAERVWLQKSEQVERVHIIGVELEPVRVTEQSVVVKTAGIAIELEEDSVGNNLQSQIPKNQDKEVKIQPQDLTLSVEKREEVVTPVTENAGGEEKVEEQEEPRILTVRRFSLNYKNSRPEPEIENLEIKKLVWIINPHKDQKQPVILEFEPPKNQNQRLYAFWHFLRKVIKKVYGEDILWTRNLTMIRADEPVEVTREIEYYLELLKGNYAQVFAFIN